MQGTPHGHPPLWQQPLSRSLAQHHVHIETRSSPPSPHACSSFLAERLHRCTHMRHDATQGQEQFVRMRVASTGFSPHSTCSPPHSLAWIPSRASLLPLCPSPHPKPPPRPPPHPPPSLWVLVAWHNETEYTPTPAWGGGNGGGNGGGQGVREGRPR